jgi:small subunit ribosomal protein S9
MSQEQKIYSGVGKRKTSVAKVFIKEGTGIITVNNSPFDIAFSALKEEKNKVKSPLVLLDLASLYDVDIKVKGGGLIGQLDAMKLAIAKALCTINQAYRPQLHQEYFLHRDARIKERRKYGLKKARKAPQYSKR